ncbi:MAG: hypothetical protein J2P57_14665 [Acidimicrobiaceae bacterium]|nr:hypothetical protein [Acidimicrobiaceae bacterium]
MERLEATAERVLQDIMRAGSEGPGGGEMNTPQGNLTWRARAADFWAWLGNAGMVAYALEGARLDGLKEHAQELGKALKATAGAEGEQVVKARAAYTSAQEYVEELVAKIRSAWRLSADDQKALSEAAENRDRLLAELNKVKASLTADEAQLGEEAARVSKLEHGITAVRAAEGIIVGAQAVLDFFWFDTKYHDLPNAFGYSMAGATPVAGGIGLAMVAGVGAAPEIAIGLAAAAVAINVQTAYVYTYERRQELDLGDWSTSHGLVAKGHFLGQAAIDYNNTYVNPPVSPNQSPEMVALESEAHMARFVILTPVGAVAAHETAKHIDDDFGDFGLPIKLGRWL